MQITKSCSRGWLASSEARQRGGDVSAHGVAVNADGADAGGYDESRPVRCRIPSNAFPEADGYDSRVAEGKIFGLASFPSSRFG